MIINKKRYYCKQTTKRLSKLQEDERIYLNVPFNKKEFASFSNCGFDSSKKLWFTGINNTFLQELIELYGVNSSTSPQTMLILKEKQLIHRLDSNLM